MNTTLIYKHHAILAAGRRDARSGEYKPLVRIEWVAPDGRQKNHSIALHQTCLTLEEANIRAVNSAKGWIDRHIVNAGHSPALASVRIDITNHDNR
jgi:hypothetical protein